MPSSEGPGITPYERLCIDLASDRITQAEFDERSGGAEGIKHGTHSAYTHAKCRCEICIEAHRTWRPKSELVHGTVRGYSSHRCRCDECKTAWGVYMRKYKTTGSAR